MKSPVFLHASDLHLGQPLSRLGRGLGKDQSESLTELAKKALISLVDATIQHQAEFLVLAGDIYDDADRESGAQVDFSLQLSRLEEHDIKVYIVHGNHDPSDSTDVPVVGLPSNVHVFQPSEPEVIRHELKGGGHVLVAGVSFSKRHEDANLAKRISDLLGKRDTRSARALIAVLHTNVGGSPGHLPYAPCTVGDLSNSPVHYWALGHVHKRRIESMGENRFWAYSGNLQGRFAVEEGPKGALLVPILENGVGQPSLVECDKFRFINTEIDCSSLTTLDKIKDAISEQIQAKAGSRLPIVSVSLTGTSSEALAMIEKVTDDGTKPTNLIHQLQRLLAPKLNDGHLQEVLVNVLPDLDFAALATRDDVIGDLLRAVESGQLKTLINEFLRDSRIASSEQLTDSESNSLHIQMKRELIRRLVRDMGVTQS